MAVIAMALGLAAAPALAGEPVRTDAGLLQGVQEGGLSVFKGVPFAAPPVGELRWREPQPAQPWTGVRRADAYGLPCMQTGVSVPYGAHFGAKAPMSEDCLYLNLWIPPAPAGARLPVMVWIYGGGFQNGSASEAIYRGDYLARHGVIVVGINYRVGMMGFFAHPALTAESPHHASGDYGLMDMIAALGWVQRNIPAFGGDPGRVTIFGQSAGSEAVNLLVASPLAKGLFQRAIGESGGEFMSGLPNAMGGLAAAEAAGKKVADQLDAHSLAELRSLTADDVTAASPAWPDIDGYVVPAPIYAIFAAGRQNDVSTLVGSTEAEGDNLLADPLKAGAYLAHMRQAYGPYADGLLALYPGGSDAEAAASQRRLQRDLGFGWEAWTWARLQARTGHAKVYQYQFAHRPPWPDRAPSKRWGAAHGSEIFYVFQHYDPGFGWTDADRRYGEVVSAYWTNFAKTGDPNGPGLPVWHAFTEAQQTVMRFGDAPVAGDLPHRPGLELIDHDVQDVWAKTGGPK